VGAVGDDGLRLRHRQRRRTAALGCVVRHSQRQTEQADNRAYQPSSLPIGEAEYGAQRQRRQDRQRRIPGLATPRCPQFRCSSCDCVIGSPHRQTGPLRQTGVVGWPIRNLVLLAWVAVTVILVRLERYDGYSELRMWDAPLTLVSCESPTADPCTTLIRAPTPVISASTALSIAFLCRSPGNSHSVAPSPATGRRGRQPARPLHRPTRTKARSLREDWRQPRLR
jgi:hypothetical protein